MVSPSSGAKGITPFEKCRNYAAVLASQMEGESRVSWESRHLKPGRMLPKEPTPEQIAAAKARVKWIVDQIYDENSAVGKEADPIFFRMIDGAPDWLTHYFRSYEIFLFSPLYQNVLLKADAALPQKGIIIDVGSGSGMLGLFTEFMSPERKVVLYDHDRVDEVVSRRRQAVLALSGKPSRASFVPLYLNARSTFSVSNADAAVFNHVLYILKPSIRERALAETFRALRSGGRVVINEPLREMATPKEKYREWLTKVIATGIEHGSPHSEFDVAFLAAMSSGRMTRPLRGGAELDTPFMTQSDLEALVTKTGFRIVDSSSTYGGFSRFLVLEKP